MNAPAFEMDYENKLIRLWEDINAGTYSPGPSLAIIVDKPVQLEIFTAAFPSET